MNDLKKKGLEQNVNAIWDLVEEIDRSASEDYKALKALVSTCKEAEAYQEEFDELANISFALDEIKDGLENLQRLYEYVPGSEQPAGANTTPTDDPTDEGQPF